MKAIIVQEYQWAVERVAKSGKKSPGIPWALLKNFTRHTREAIQADPEAFEEAVRMCRYGLAMQSLNHPEE